jgi:hypothetical protein
MRLLASSISTRVHFSLSSKSVRTPRSTVALRRKTYQFAVVVPANADWLAGTFKVDGADLLAIAAIEDASRAMETHRGQEPCIRTP